MIDCETCSFVRVPFRDAVSMARAFIHDVCLNRRYALPMSREQIRGVVIAVLGFVTIYALAPSLRHYVWPAIAWTIFVMSAMAALACVGDIVVVMYHMFYGYIPEDERRITHATTDIQKKRPRFEARGHTDKRGRVA